jgi:hypothetical protein
MYIQKPSAGSYSPQKNNLYKLFYVWRIIWDIHIGMVNNNMGSWNFSTVLQDAHSRITIPPILLVYLISDALVSAILVIRDSSYFKIQLEYLYQV